MDLLQTSRGSFSGHETFPVRYTWLRKAVQQTKADQEVFNRPDAMVRFGVGKNMVRSIRHWGLVCGIIDENPFEENNRGRKLMPTGIGAKLFLDEGWDPFMEDPATLWLIHWRLASTPSPATTWYWAFNHTPTPEFSRQELLGWLSDMVGAQGWKHIARSSLKRDIDTFVRTYVPVQPSRSTPIEDTLDCPLVELGLLRERETRGTYQLVRGVHPDLPDELFAFGLAEFLERTESTSTCALESVALAPGSPGRVFCLSEEGLMRRLERLGKLTERAMTYDETAGLRQILIRRRLDPTQILERYYTARRPS